MSMMFRMMRWPSDPSLGQDPMIPIRQFDSTVVLDQEVEEERDEEGPGERVGVDEVEREVSRNDEEHAFCDGETVMEGAPCVYQHPSLPICGHRLTGW